MYLSEVLQKIELATGHSSKRSGNSYVCHCPAHDDQNPSLSVSETAEGKILLKCHAGCEVENICHSIDVAVSDLFSKPRDSYQTSPERVEYIYEAANGKPLYKKVREAGKRFFIQSQSEQGIWENGLSCLQRVLYRLPQVLNAKSEGKTIFLVEGEKDAERLHLLGLTATTPLEGAGSQLRREYADQLEGCHVALLYDEDPAGHSRREQWKRLLAGRVASLKVIALPGLQFQEKGGPDISDWLSSGHTKAELLQLVETALVTEMENPKKAIGLKVVHLEEFLQQNIPPREMILEPIIPSQGLIMLYSKRGVGKTFLSIAIGLAVSTGTPLLRWRADKPYKVLYVDGEMPAPLMQERLSQLILGLDAELPDPSYFRLVTPDLQEEGIPDISSSKGQELIEASLEKDTKLVVLDNLSTLAPSLQENEADAWGPFQTWVLKLRRMGLSVLIVHHAGKSGQQRGTSRREDVLDTVLVLKHAESYSAAEGAAFEIHLQKARGIFGEEAEPLSAKLETNEEGGLRWITQSIRDELCEAVAEKVRKGESYRTIAESLKISKSKVEGLVKKAREQGDLPGVKG